MTHSIQEIAAKHAQLTEPMQQEVLNFIEFMYAKVARLAVPSKHEPALLCEQALATDWSWPEEDNAWRSLTVLFLSLLKRRPHPSKNLTITL